MLQGLFRFEASCTTLMLRNIVSIAHNKGVCGPHPARSHIRNSFPWWKYRRAALWRQNEGWTCLPDDSWLKHSSAWTSAEFSVESFV